MADSTQKVDGAPSAEGPRNISRDGDKVADMEYYDLLGVSANSTDLDLKKHIVKLQSKIIQTKKKPTDEVGLKEATEMFGNLFGGERFIDLIGEISLLRDFGKASEIMMTEEEREEIEKNMRKNKGKIILKLQLNKQQFQPANLQLHLQHQQAVHLLVARLEKQVQLLEQMQQQLLEQMQHPQPIPPKKQLWLPARNLASQKLTPEQRQKLEALEKEKREAEEKRIIDLTQKLKDRIRPFVEARNPDLKLESFGIELLHTIGNIYLTKSTTWVKSQRQNFLGVPGFFSRLKEKGSMVKETWGLMGSAMSVLVSMEDIARRQEKGDVDEEEMRKLEQDMSSKMLLATWRGARSEVNGVLRKVCDNVLHEKGIDNKTLLYRARALAFLGAIYKSVQPEEGDEERRELERLVAEAAGKNKKKKEKRSRLGTPAATASPAETGTPAPESAAKA
ncbi:hypothetical protein L7F22_042258 [Adiantum nelumboides]|nr:hypothetical protein [Adiantum nelumboides]